MTSSITQICNQALADIGARATISSLADPTPTANYCSLWYDTLRQNLLRAAQWGFARFQLSLAQVGDLYPDNTSPYPWLFQYAYPSDTIKFRYVLAPPILPAEQALPGATVIGPTWLGPSRQNRFIISSSLDQNNNQTKTLLTNISNAIGVYTKDITDPSLFDPGFQVALAAALSYKLVVPLTGNAGMRQEFRNTAELEITKARAMDGESIPSSDHTPDWIKVRGVGSPFGYPGFGAAGDAGAGWGSWWGGYDDFNWGA